MTGWVLSSDELNGAISKLDNEREDLAPSALHGTGKVVPYAGWYWRPVDWDRACTNGYHLYRPSRSPYREMMDDPPSWYSFMENNKWGYETAWLSPEAMIHIRQALEEAVQNPTKRAFETVFSIIQVEGAGQRGG